MDLKEFKEIEGFNNYYIAHSPPRVFRKIGGEYLECTQTKNSRKDPYWTVTMRSNSGKFLKRSVHRLLMLAFVPNPEGKAHVNHIDGDKTNNNMDNLEWATPKENALHAIRIGLTDTQATSKEVHQYTLSGEYVRSYSSGVEASKVSGVESANIRTCALGKRPMAGFFQWRYVKYDSIPPCKSKYLDYYLYDGKKFKSLGEVAKHIGYSGDITKVSFSSFKRDVRESILTVYKT